jgi:ribosomal protein L24
VTIEKGARVRVTTEGKWKGKEGEVVAEWSASYGVRIPGLPPMAFLADELEVVNA